MSSKKTVILDTTLRDGSYSINFSFTALDTTVICRGLESAGFKFIEVGHGAGLNAGKVGHGVPAATDEEYMEAAASSVKAAKYGMFCIPGIARLSDLNAARRHKMGFIRIGTNVDEIEASKPFIKKAKDAGMFVAANYMKSYALDPVQFAQKVKLSERYGADAVYVVDSAGGMFPDAIRQFYEEIRKVSDIPLGFHGHNNLGMAVYNSFYAAELGFEYVDASLQGIGRSSGNACTEMLVGVLKKAGYHTGIDFLETLKVGHKYVQPLIARKGEMPLDVVSGFAEFHSSYMPQILKCAAKYRVEPEKLIIEACKVDKVNLRPDRLQAIAKRMKHSPDLFIGDYGIDRYVGGEQEGHGRRKRAG